MINGYSYLKKMYPGLDSDDYQPAGLDLRIGKIYEFGPSEDQMIGIINGIKLLPNNLKEVSPIIFSNNQDNEEYEVFELKPDTSYIVQVLDPIKISKNSAQLYLPRSTLLRCGVDVCSSLGDPGYSGYLRFMVINHNKQSFFIEKNERFAQLIDIKVEGVEESYNGDYQEDID